MIELEETEEELIGCANEYQTVKSLIDGIEDKGGAVCIWIPGQGYTDIDNILEGNGYAERITNDLKVYLIELRHRIRERLAEDESSSQGITASEPEQEPEEEWEQGELRAMPKNDYRRQGRELT